MLNFKQTAKPSNYKPSPVNSRDRLVVRTLRCGRSNPGSNPGLGNNWMKLFSFFKRILTQVQN